jgi:hypothetical protein
MSESPRSARCGLRELPAAGKPALQKKSPEGFIPPGLFLSQKLKVSRIRPSGERGPAAKPFRNSKEFQA